MPSQEIIALVKLWKQLLRKALPSRFGSVNSLAHITIACFSDDVELEKYFIKIENFCLDYPSREIIFDGFGWFGDETFYIKPNLSSRKYLNAMIRNFHRFVVKTQPSNIAAHMTIARELDQVSMQIAKQLFTDYQTGFRFLCDGFLLRKFNPNTQQYSDIVKEFKFVQPQFNLFRRNYWLTKTNLPWTY